MIIGYARVSTKYQSLELQEEQLLANGCEIIFKDKMTGAKMDRPNFKKCLELLRIGDTLVVTKLDRLARNTKEGIQIIDNLFSKGVKINVLNMGILDNSTTGRFFIQTMLAVAEIERSMMIDRIQEGIDNLKKRGTTDLGRPLKFRKTQIDHALELYKTYTGAEVERMTGISRSTLKRAKRREKVRQMTKENPELLKGDFSSIE